MTDEQIKYSIEKKELRLGFWDKLTHYAIVWSLLLIPIITLFFNFKKNNYRTIKINIEEFDWFVLIVSLLSILFYILQKNRLKFKVFETKIEKEKLESIVKKVAKENDWSLYQYNKNAMIFKTHPSIFSGSWGEQVTVLFNENEILVNSICDPDERSSIVSMGRNKKNVTKLIKEFKKNSR